MKEGINSTNEFLDKMVYIINSQRMSFDDVGELKNVLEQVDGYYKTVIKLDDFYYEKLYNVLGQDVELYCLVTSAIYDVTNDSRAIVAIEDVLLSSEVEPYTADKILSNVNILKFAHFEIPNSYKKNRELNKKYLDKYEEKYPCKCLYIPFEERNKNRIVIETNTLLEVGHAPTRMVLNICKYLQEGYGYEVFLIVNRSNSRYEDLAQVWNVPSRYNYREDIEGRF